jgi:hypothetical protein
LRGFLEIELCITIRGIVEKKVGKATIIEVSVLGVSTAGAELAIFDIRHPEIAGNEKGPGPGRRGTPP